MNLDMEEIGLVLVIIIMHYCFRIIQISTLLWLQKIYIIDACVEHIIEQTSLAG